MYIYTHIHKQGGFFRAQGLFCVPARALGADAAGGLLVIQGGKLFTIILHSSTCDIV